MPINSWLEYRCELSASVRHYLLLNDVITNRRKTTLALDGYLGVSGRNPENTAIPTRQIRIRFNATRQYNGSTAKGLRGSEISF